MMVILEFTLAIILIFFEVNILDAVAENEYDYGKFLNQIKLEEPDIVVLECSTPTIDIDVWFANKVAEFSKKWHLCHPIPGAWVEGFIFAV